jgi:hypothetical protein
LLPLIAPLISGHSDLDSREDVLATARQDLAGIVRLANGFARRTIVPEVPAEIEDQVRPLVCFLSLRQLMGRHRTRE